MKILNRILIYPEIYKFNSFSTLPPSALYSKHHNFSHLEQSLKLEKGSVFSKLLKCLIQELPMKIFGNLEFFSGRQQQDLSTLHFTFGFNSFIYIFLALLYYYSTLAIILVLFGQFHLLLFCSQRRKLYLIIVDFWGSYRDIKSSASSPILQTKFLTNTYRLWVGDEDSREYNA